MFSEATISNVREAFERFKQDPFSVFSVKLRRHRSKQLRELLKDPDQVAVEAFNREVWASETATMLAGQDIKGELSHKKPPSRERLMRLESALEIGELELHGNYTWGAGSRVYAPNIKSDEDKLKYIQQAIRVLNTPQLAPLEKARQLMDVPGFGPNISTGLVMMFHPEDFAIFNQKSVQAIHLLGSRADSLEAFEETAQELKGLFGAGDFLELDWFLFLIAEGLIQIPGATESMSEKLARWRQEHLPAQRIKVREQAEHEARELLATKAGDFQEADLRNFFALMNRDFLRNKLNHTRFGLAYVGHNVNILVEQLDSVNEWIRKLWKTSNDQLELVLDEFYKNKPIRNAGVAFPSLILYLRDQAYYNFCFQRTVDGLAELTGFAKSHYSGDFYMKYNEEVNELKRKYTLIPQEVDVILCLAESERGPKPPITPPVGKSAFSQRTFELLRKLRDNPTREFYLENKEDFRTHLEAPFQEVMKKVGEKLRAAVGAYLELDKHLFSRIVKNDWGQGGAWDFYWGAFYPKGSKRVQDAQLFLWINHEMVEFGFYIGEYGTERRKHFLHRCKEHSKALEGLLEGSLAEPNFVFGEWKTKGVPVQALKKDWDVSWKQWLADPEAHGVHICGILDEQEVLSFAEDRLVDVVADAFGRLFPLMLLVISQDPLLEIAEYLGSEVPSVSQALYTLEQCSHDTEISVDQMGRWVSAVERKGQAILYGPPGTGKTFVAECLARHLVGGGDGFVELVQFHPTYAYEDFVQGLRPRAREHGGLDYSLVPGRFLEVCEKARRRKDVCVLIIDEINRANLSRVFGELMYLLEYRAREIPLASGGLLSIPPNLRIIGTMNTADRSIALVDHALRRRFAFLALYPNYEILRRYHARTGFNVGPLVDVLTRLNQQIGDRHYEVGITFFLRKDLATQLRDIWETEVEPYLEEYFFDQPDKVETFRWAKVGKEIHP